ncbi:MAG: arylsulfatase [Ignavibacteriales bacterium]|nr:arylsulfatase [Ignavibacteriales bacterium]
MKNLSRREFVKLVGLNAAVFSIGGKIAYGSNKKKNPNIIYILADDLGYGDISWLNENSKINTANIDKLAKNGISFIDAHSGSAVCTPTRYGILTGRYCWRTKLQNGVTWGYSDPLIDADRLTVAKYLKNNGYTTGCVGKWHLGWNWELKDEFKNSDLEKIQFDYVDFSKPIKNGPIDVGFDYFYGIPGSLDMEPYVYIENDKVDELPTSKFEGLTDYQFARSGPASPSFNHQEVLTKLTDKAVSFINQKSNNEKPFFLYFSLTAPHTPILPENEFKGKSGIGPYGDFVLQCDWTVGKIVEAVKEQGLQENTLIIFTSDNGCSPQAKFEHLETFGHDPSYVFRGHKADIFEGGHRIPFIASWPGIIPKESFCSDPICLTDLIATTSDIIGDKLPENSGEDSISILDDLKKTSSKPLREAIVHHSIDGLFAIRKGKWKLELSPGSGGWSSPRNFEAFNKNMPMLQLYDLENDIAEKNNVQDQYPEIVNELINLLEKYVEDGRSTPGIKQKNDVDVNIWKYLKNRRNSIETEKIEHLGLAAKVMNFNGAVIAYASKGLSSINDGIRGTENFQDGSWAGIEGEDLELIFELKEKHKINSITIGTLQNQSSWIFLPNSISVFYYDENDKINLADKKTFIPSAKNDEVLKKDIKLELKNISSNKLKIIIESIKICPDWHSGKGGKAWMFIDEIIIDEK